MMSGLGREWWAVSPKARGVRALPELLQSPRPFLDLLGVACRKGCGCSLWCVPEQAVVWSRLWKLHPSTLPSC